MRYWHKREFFNFELRKVINSLAAAEILSIMDLLNEMLNFFKMRLLQVCQLELTHGLSVNL